MSGPAAQPLDSYRYLQAQAPMCCYLCGEQNHYATPRCRRCHAPLALSYQAASQRVRPKLLPVLGLPAAGKTTHLGLMMDVLSRRSGPVELLARGAFSIAVQQDAVQSLVHGRFPEATPKDAERWSWLHCHVRHAARRRSLELVVPDVSGRALAEEWDLPGSYPVIRPLLGAAAALLVAIDVTQIGREQDYFLLKMFGYLSELRRRRGWQGCPAAFVLTKADRRPECFDELEELVERELPAVKRHAEQLLPVHRFFAASVVGAVACRWQRGVRVEVPLRVEPRGVCEPILWIMDQLARRRLFAWRWSRSPRSIR